MEKTLTPERYISKKHLIDFTKGRAKGYASQEYSLGNAEAAQAIMHNEFPFVGEVEFLRVTNGDVTKNIVMHIRPTERVVDGKSAKA